MSDESGCLQRYRRLQAERLRARFPNAGLHHPSLADKDQDHLTSDRRGHLALRTFFLGEIFRTAPNHPGFWPPALVTRRQFRAHESVEFAPAARHRPGNDEDPWIFVPQVRGERLAEDSVFLLSFRRPVPREAIGEHLDTLDGWDKQRLALQITNLQRSLD